jgi:hypothetical protein
LSRLSAQPTIGPDYPWLGRPRPFVQENFVMTTSRSTSSFRPGLEALETRAMPSGLSFSLFSVNNQLATDTKNMASLVQKMEDTQHQLTTDIHRSGRPATAGSPEIDNDYRQASNLYGQIQSLNSQIGALKGQELQLEEMAFFLGDDFDQGFAQVLFFAKANPAVASLFGLAGAPRSADDLAHEANDIRDRPEDNSFPSIGQGADDLAHGENEIHGGPGGGDQGNHG